MSGKDFNISIKSTAPLSSICFLVILVLFIFDLEKLDEFVNKLKAQHQRFAIRQMQKIYFDLPKLAKYILSESNISSVHDIKKNTFLDKNYFSFRESKKKKQKDYGRNINLISII